MTDLELASINFYVLHSFRMVLISLFVCLFVCFFCCARSKAGNWLGGVYIK